MDGEHGEFPVSVLHTQTAKYVRNRCGTWLQEVGRGTFDVAHDTRGARAMTKNTVRDARSA